MGRKRNRLKVVYVFSLVQYFWQSSLPYMTLLQIPRICILIAADILTIP